jgi:hypothetical protein
MAVVILKTDWQLASRKPKNPLNKKQASSPQLANVAIKAGH